MADEDTRRIEITHSLSAKKRFCPHCLTEMQAATSMSGWLLPEEYNCSKCGYTGSFFLETSKE